MPEEFVERDTGNGPARNGLSTERPDARASNCRNCSAPVSSNYCPDCGQTTSLHPPSVWEFAHEVVSHYIAAEGKLWRTLALLVLQPGKLTVEYLAGRRQRYIIPLRLYLTASFLFFAVAQGNAWSTYRNGDRLAAQDVGQAVAPALPSRDGGAGDEMDSSTAVSGAFSSSSFVENLRAEHFSDCLQPGARCPLWKSLLAPAMRNLLRDPDRAIERFRERFRHSLSFAMFCLLPIFAGLLALAYRRRRMYYGEHLVFALHVHSFWFFLAFATALLPDVIGPWLALGLVGYCLWAQQRVYGGRSWTTLLRGMAITVPYSLVIGVGAAGLALALLST